MTDSLATPLTADELASLKEVYKGPLQRRIPADHKAKLIAAGYILPKMGGPLMTELGTRRLVLERK